MSLRCENPFSLPMAFLEKETIKKPHIAMVLAAGLGSRLRPITTFLPKALVKIQGKTLLGRILDQLEAINVEKIVINSHYLSEQIEDFVHTRNNIASIFLSKEKTLLDTGGSIVKALPLLGDTPFYILAGDILYEDAEENALNLLASHWDDTKMDALLLLQEKEKIHGYSGQGDFDMDRKGCLYRPEGARAYLFVSLWMAHPRFYATPPASPFSNSQLFFNHIQNDTKKIDRIYGVTYSGKIFHISTPSDVTYAEEHYASNLTHPL